MTTQTPLADIQGQTDVSPYAGDTVTITAMVTEPLGDTWFMQDMAGPWNGLMVVGPDVLIPAYTPYWNSDRQPEVGDLLTLHGTVEEVEGNTQLMGAELVEFVNFWMATPIGTWLTADQFQDEQHEGTRVRIDNATVVSEPNADAPQCRRVTAQPVSPVTAQSDPKFKTSNPESQIQKTGL